MKYLDVEKYLERLKNHIAFIVQERGENNAVVKTLEMVCTEIGELGDEYFIIDREVVPLEHVKTPTDEYYRCTDCGAKLSTVYAYESIDEINCCPFCGKNFQKPLDI